MTDSMSQVEELRKEVEALTRQNNRFIEKIEAMEAVMKDARSRIHSYVCTSTRCCTQCIDITRELLRRA